MLCDTLFIVVLGVEEAKTSILASRPRDQSIRGEKTPPGPVSPRPAGQGDISVEGETLLSQVDRHILVGWWSFLDPGTLHLLGISRIRALRP